jgi:hypothetical protein
VLVIIIFSAQSTGVGISLPDNIFLGSIPNNSAVVYEEGMLQEVFCHSARKSSCVSGQWIGTSDLEANCEDSEGVTFDHVAFNLSTVSNYGIHSCVIADERGVEQSLFIGIYNSGA